MKRDWKRKEPEMKKIWILVLALSMLGTQAFARVEKGDLLEGVKPGPDGMIDVLTVFAHQDDESIPGGGALLKMKKDPRVRIHIMCLTLGDMSEAKDWLKITPAHLGRIRSEELETAAAVYQAEQVIQLQYHDQGLTSADQEQLVAEVRQVIEQVGAEIVITHEPSGTTGHPDHITTSRTATQAFPASCAQRLYYVTVPRYIYVIRSAFSPVLNPGGEIPDPVWPTLRVNIREEKKLKHLAMYSHASQKHFSLVGIGMDMMGVIPAEWFALADTNE
jgi:LmbE family N-acetylglucosaminyl deacetylase